MAKILAKSAAVGLFLSLAVAGGTSPAAVADVLNGSDIRNYREALDAAARSDHSAAAQAAARASDPILRKVVTWERLRADHNGDFAETARFLADNPNWPDRSTLMLQAERRMPTLLAPAEIVAHHDAFPPQTYDAVLNHIRGLMSVGRENDARAVARDRWHSQVLTADQQSEYLGLYGGFLTEADHIERLDNLLWANRESEARRMSPLVDDGYMRLADARIRLANRDDGVDDAINRVPNTLADDEGLLYERLRWRRYYGYDAGAIEILDQQPPEMKQPNAWWRERNIIVRRLFEDGRYAEAQRLAAEHGTDGGSSLAEAEWLAGWFALRFLDRPNDALSHFVTLFENVGTPISLARGAYWAGRSHEALGNTDEAEEWYARAAVHDTVFYGQLAAGKLGRPTVAGLSEIQEHAGADATADPELARVTIALGQIGAEDLQQRFMAALLGASTSASEIAAAGRLALEDGNTFMAVRGGKMAVMEGRIIPDIAFPVANMSNADDRIDPAFVHAIIRQESEFNPRAVSRSNARGLMQLLPATAQDVAHVLGVSHSTGMLTADPAHNIRLGSRYLADQVARFGGSYILAAAGYNGGPNRVAGWLSERGDPRRMSDIDEIIDWMESIPIYETRNYVQRVLENTQVYRIRMGQTPRVGMLEEDLTR
ncbi:lytic transglycosylase domain-containing protein [Fodinicurvata sp. EGI_FJ10296]|uniref:lytic transglycosylase domain-containing protein n=1 Tax=Fodinicurvata sp. EGI_FJ10296 TaxID=3231908 RepID=UPI0034520837